MTKPKSQQNKIQSGWMTLRCYASLPRADMDEESQSATDTTHPIVNLPGRAEQKARAAAAPTAKREYLTILWFGVVGLK